MFARLTRLILAFACFPLIGAYALRWAGGFLRDVAEMASVHHPLLAFLDIALAVLGVVLGIIWAVQLVGCCFQPEASPVRATGDTILIVLALTLLTDIVLTRVLPESVIVTWLPAANLVIWASCAAATMSLSRWRAELRYQATRRTVPPTPGPNGPDA